MSLFSALSVSLTGLQTVTSQMQLVANNISNAGNEGFTKKSAILGSVTLGTEGGGTTIIGFSRSTSDSVATALNQANSDAGFRGAQNDYLQQLQSVLGASSGSNPGLSDAIAQFASAWRQLGAAPENIVNQQQVVQTANNLVSQIQTLSAGVESLDRQVTTDINGTVSDLNSKLASISDLNKKISAAMGTGQSAGNLQDQRDILVQEVAGIVKVKVMQREQGQIALFTPDGYSLVDGQAQSFTYDGTNVKSTTDTTLTLNNVLAGGKLQALVAFRSTTSPVSTDPATSVIQKLRSQLDAVAAAFTTSSAGPPATFAYAYANAVGTSTEATSIFTGSDRSNFAVNSGLVDGSRTVKIASPSAVIATLNNSTKSFSADGLNVTSASYETLGASIISVFQQAANSVASLNTTANGQKTYLKQRLSNDTGVNVDTEMVSLTTLQNSYAASARVISTINQMFQVLENMV